MKSSTLLFCVFAAVAVCNINGEESADSSKVAKSETLERSKRSPQIDSGSLEKAGSDSASREAYYDASSSYEDLASDEFASVELASASGRGVSRRGRGRGASKRGRGRGASKRGRGASSKTRGRGASKNKQRGRFYEAYGPPVAYGAPVAYGGYGPQGGGLVGGILGGLLG